MLKIGAFARLARVSTRMLRHYDRLGLLKPAVTDPTTRYRFYTLAQLPRLRQISVLRELDFALEEIALLVNDEGELDVRRLLETKRSELRQRIARDNTRLQRIEARLGTLNAEELMETATEHDLLLNLLRTKYGLDVELLEPLHSVENGRIYLARGSNKERWEVHASPTRSLADTMHTTWLSGYRGHSMTDFLLSRAGLLMHLQAQRFPTQQVVRSRDGQPLGAQHGWSALVTTTFPSFELEPMGSSFRALGATLGRLHTLSIAPATELPIGQGWFYPEQALREALHYLRTAQEQGPASWRPLLAAFSAVLETVQQRPLPRTLIHGDPYLKRVAQADDGSLTLRDWHSGGLGVAVLDLGRLLYGCHLSPAEPWPWTIAPQPERIAAVLEGYQAHRRLRAVERTSLLEAIQFGIAYGASEHIARGLTSGWSAALDTKLAVRRQWFEASVEIARIAQPAIRSEG